MARMKLRSGVQLNGDGDVSEEDKFNSPTMDGDSTAPTSKQPTVSIFGWQVNRVLVVTHFCIVLYSTCFWIQTPLFPYMSKKLGADTVMIGYLSTVFAVSQLIGGPIFGRFGDLFGGQAAMILAFASAALSYLILGLATSVPMLFMSRAASMLMHTMQGGQMIVTDTVDPSQRAAALGRLGFSYGIGMVVGPAIGGFISNLAGDQSAAFAAFGGSILSIILCLIFVPKHTKREDVKPKEAGSGLAMLNVKKYFSLLAHPTAALLLLVRVIIGIPIGVFQSMFPVISMETFKLPQSQNGMLMSYIGFVTIGHPKSVVPCLIQGLGITFISKRYSENSIIKWSSFLLIWAFLMLSFIQNLWQLCLVILPLVVGLVCMNIVISSALTHTVSDADTGTMLGLNMAVNSLIRTMSPTVGGFMLDAAGFPSIGYLGCVAALLATAITFTKLKG